MAWWDDESLEREVEAREEITVCGRVYVKY
jgi:hypothetical protein